MTGCGHGDAAVTEWKAPVVIDLASKRCPRVDQAARREFTLTVPGPLPDAVTADGRPAISERRWRAKADEMREAIHRKNLVGRRLIRESDGCLEVSQAPAS